VISTHRCLVILSSEPNVLQNKLLKKADLEYWRQEFKGITAKDIANRIITHFRPDVDEESDCEQDLARDLLEQESDDEDEPATVSDEQSEIDEDNDVPTKDMVMLDSECQASCLPNSVKYRYSENLPPYWPNPLSDNYQAFFRSFFFGEARDAITHDWKKELDECKSIPASRGCESTCALSVWQAAGYLHAKKVVLVPSIKGCLFYWTPGSGKSIMVALLLDVLFKTDYKVFVVSSPQNTRQNDLECCAKSLLKFSPIFNLGGREPTTDDVNQMRKLLRNRPNGPPIFKKNFMTFRQFGKFCLENGPSCLEKAAVIIDESHLLFDEKKCDKNVMWGTVLETLTQAVDSKVFTFSGTPGKNKKEALLQLELVRHASTRTNHGKLLEESDDWQQRLMDYAAGLVSYVDGTKDLSRYPVNCGVDKVNCEMSFHQLHNFSARCQDQLRGFGAHDLEELFAPIQLGSGEDWKDAVRKARLTQSAGTVFWGGSKVGLSSELWASPGPTVESLIRYAPKFKAVVECLLHPPRTDPLLTKHFIYSSNIGTISHFADTLGELRSESQDEIHLFKQLFAHDFEWASSEELELNLAKPLELDHPQQVLYLVLSGKAEEKKKLKAAFGQITPDGTRYEGLQRADGSPLIQALLGSQECNQGLTFLRLQHIHLMEPNPKGWSEVLCRMRVNHDYYSTEHLCMRRSVNYVFSLSRSYKALVGVFVEIRIKA
jgi:hypothetical protein